MKCINFESETDRQRVGERGKERHRPRLALAEGIAARHINSESRSRERGVGSGGVAKDCSGN